MDAPPSKSTRWFFEEVQIHEPSLRAYLRRAFPWLSDADDLVQDVMSRAWRAAQEGTIRSGRAFVFAAARNAALDLFRRRRIVTMEPLAESGPASVLDDGVDVAETVSRHEELALLREAIRSLPERCRQVLVLRKIHGLPQKEIAARLGISEHTVEVQTANAVHRCADFLRGRGMSERETGRA